MLRKLLWRKKDSLLNPDSIEVVSEYADSVLKIWRLGWRTDYFLNWIVLPVVVLFMAKFFGHSNERTVFEEIFFYSFFLLYFAAAVNEIDLKHAFRLDVPVEVIALLLRRRILCGALLLAWAAFYLLNGTQALRFVAIWLLDHVSLVRALTVAVLKQILDAIVAGVIFEVVRKWFNRLLRAALIHRL